MSFAVNESFQDTPDSDDIVWRYMDTAKFLSLLQDRALAFASASTMTDRWEGSYSSPVVAKLEAASQDDIGTQYLRNTKMRSAVKRLLFMSCWHVSPVESAAMWSIYQSESRGIAIRSTWYRLVVSISDEYPMTGGLVSYVDYRTADFDPTNALTAYAHKRRSFEHEREARLVFLGGDEAKNNATVLKFPTDLTRLIEAVHIAPNSPTWYREVIENVVKQYGFQFPVVQSDLSEDPLG